jgi:hypothetical protein
MARLFSSICKTSGAGISFASRVKRLTCTLSDTCLQTRHGNRSSFGISPIKTNPSVCIFMVSWPSRDRRTGRFLSHFLFLSLIISPLSEPHKGAQSLLRLVLCRVGSEIAFSVPQRASGCASTRFPVSRHTDPQCPNCQCNWADGSDCFGLSRLVSVELLRH